MTKETVKTKQNKIIVTLCTELTAHKKNFIVRYERSDLYQGLELEINLREKRNYLKGL